MQPLTSGGVRGGGGGCQGDLIRPLPLTTFRASGYSQEAGGRGLQAGDAVGSVCATVHHMEPGEGRRRNMGDRDHTGCNVRYRLPC